MLTVLVGILVVFFVGGAIITAILEAIGMIFGIGSLAGVSIIGKIKRRLKKKKEREVTVFCPCSNQFLATPHFDNNWIVLCPSCGKSLRVDLSNKKHNKKHT